MIGRRAVFDPEDPSCLAELGAADAAKAIRAGAVRAASLIEALLARIEAASDLHAFVTVDADRALRSARAVDQARAAGRPLGRLAGVPLAIKDNIHVAGLPNTAGTPGLRAFMPTSNAPVVGALAEAGAIVIGKTNMHELAFGITSSNAAFGAVPTPYDLRCFAGGSSGGTAAAVAARLVPAGLGTDTGGSVRIPAALTGTVGFRPSTGRYAREGLTPIARSRDTAGPMARRVGDLRLLDEILAGTAPGPEPAAARGLRLGLERDHLWAELDPELAEVAEEALSLLRSGGVELVDIAMPGLAELSSQVGFPVSGYEARLELSDYLKRWDTGLELEALAAEIATAEVKHIFDAYLLGAQAVTEASYRTAVDELLPALRRLYEDTFTAHRLDALLFPTTPLPARPIAGSEETVMLGGRRVPTFEAFLRNTYPGASAGLPGLSLPAGLTAQGLPVGLELDGRPGSDRRLLAIGSCVEGLLPALPPPAETWRSRPPHGRQMYSQGAP